jgi:hypothetical protein
MNGYAMTIDVATKTGSKNFAGQGPPVIRLCNRVRPLRTTLPPVWGKSQALQQRRPSILRSAGLEHRPVGRFLP